MTYNVIDDFTKLRINLPKFMEVVKILDELNTRMEVVVTNPRKHQNITTVKPKGKVPPFYTIIENHDVILQNFLVDS